MPEEVKKAMAGLGSMSMNRSSVTLEKAVNTAQQLDKRKALVDARHKYLIEKFAPYASAGGVSTAELESSLLYGNKLDIVNDFFKEGGSKKVFFMWQPTKDEPVQMSLLKGQSGPKMGLIVSDGTKDGIRGNACYFFRTTTKAITLQSVFSDVYFGILDKNIIQSLTSVLKHVLLPSLQVQDQWGVLTRKDNTMAEYEDTLVRAIDELESASSSLQSIIQFKSVDLSQFRKEEDFVNALHQPELVNQVEGSVNDWCKIVEQVLSESEQMRRESDEIGPRHELDHWKQRMLKFSTIVEQVQSNAFQTTLKVLQAVKSKQVLKKWSELDERIRDAVNEASDNCKYLLTLEKFIEPLYKSTPEHTEHLPPLLNAIKMTQQVSRFYNTSERLTSLFVKITNQLVSQCRTFLISGSQKLLEQEPEKLRERIHACAELNRFYQNCFHKIKDSSPGAFDFSEIYIFGKFDGFVKRLMKVKDYLDQIDRFSHLSELDIESNESLMKKFSQVQQALLKKNYDILDAKKTEFDQDYLQFKKSITDFERQVLAAVDVVINQQPNTETALNAIIKYDAVLRKMKLSLADRMNEQFLHYTRRDLEMIRRIYEKFKDSPPPVKNFPPVSSAIEWSRLLYHRIEAPMLIFQEKSETLLASEEGKKYIKVYNKLAGVLVEYELLWYKSWLKVVKPVMSSLNATVLVQSPDLSINFDPNVLQLIKEVTHLKRMDLQVPDECIDLVRKEGQLVNQMNRLKDVLESKKEITGRLQGNTQIKKAVAPFFDKLQKKLEPGLTLITWNSLQLNPFIAELEAEVGQLKVLVDKLVDILEIRIKTLLESVENLNLFEITSDKLYLINEFISQQEARIPTIIELINSKSTLIQTAISEIGQLGVQTQNLNFYFAQQLYESITKCLKQSLESFKHRLMSNVSLFKVGVQLSNQQLSVNPKLEEIQLGINKVNLLMLEICKGVRNWKSLSKEEGEADFALISSNKDVNKIINSLSSVIISQVKKDLDQFLSLLNFKYSAVWKDDVQSKQLESFRVCDFEDEMNKFETLRQDVSQEANLKIFLISIELDDFKRAALGLLNEWSKAIGKQLEQRMKQELTFVVDFCDQNSVKLDKKISDLDDLKNAIECLRYVIEMETDMQMKLAHIEESYTLLNKHQYPINREDSELVDTLRYRYKKLQIIQEQVQSQVVGGLEAKFRQDLLTNLDKFSTDLDDFTREYDQQGPMQANLTPKQASDKLTYYQRIFDELSRKNELYSQGLDLFQMPQRDFPNMARFKKELKLLQSLYSLYNDVLDRKNSFNDMLFSEVQFDKLNTEMQDYQNKIKKLPKAMKDWDAFVELKKTVDDLTVIIPLLEQMSNKSLKARHWDQISDICQTKFDRNPDTFRLKTLLDAPLLLQKREDIEEICVAAVKEADIETKLKAVVVEWEEKTFTLAAFKTRGNILLKPSSTAEIISSMEDSLMTLSSLMSNRYNAPFKEQIQLWVQRLSTASEVIENWLQVQNLWIYLEAVFVGGDIAKQMPKEAKRFQGIDKNWLKIMQTAGEKPSVIYCCTQDESISSLLPHMTEQLELCQKSLSGYLESKRAIFPRFYFVSDPALLEILGQASDCHTIQAHLRSVFDNLVTVQFHEKEYEKILAIESGEGERVPLSKPVSASGNVEIWLGVLLDAMQKTINDIMRDASARMNDLPLLKFIDDYPAQIGLVGLQMKFTQMTEEALMQCRQDKKKMAQTLQAVTDILNTLIDVTTKDLSKMDRVKFETLITIQVHHRDVFEKFVKQNVKAVDDFEWLKQARFYWRPAKDACIVSITNYDFRYQCEYLGCTDRLVITPLTDRCYITLAQAMGMSLGGSPAGPAGTGKTETTKDLGKALGKWVVVFNCSDQMDYRGLGRIFKGLAQSGCWGCFDEFNRIELPVLSVAAQQVGCILSAKRERKKQFVFTDGDTVDLNPEVGYFITMNPGYAGRVELPENLKVHFRYVAMMVPNREIIIRVKLAGCGFQQNIVLAKKFFVLYRLCEEQLSKQVHYDFGLRNILSVLRSCGAVKRASPQDSESLIIMRVLRDMNLSKLVDEDENLFMSLINDLFPGLTASKASYPTMEAAIEQQVQEAGLISYPPWILKVIQLYETCKVRHGIMVLGPTGAGKTECIRTLLKAMTACGDAHKEMRMNPKAITDFQMFGRLDVATNDWTDGIFSSLWRKTIKKKGEYVWIVLDGPVDAVWIENLNSVLDDNKTLTLANGDRLTMSPTCKLVFEVDSLRNASPATVSRCGMIYMGVTALSWDIVSKGWLKKRQQHEQQVLEPLLTSSFGAALQYLQTELKPKMDIGSNSYISSLTSLLDGLIPKQQQLSNEHLQKLYTFALFWTLGSLLELNERKKLQQFLLEKVPSLDYPKLEAQSDTLFEYFVDDQGQWRHWQERVPVYNYPQETSPEFSSIIIPNVDNVRSEFLIDCIAKQGKGVLLIGEPGTAKTVTIQRYIAKLNAEVFMSKSMSFSSATTPNIFQRSVESYVDKRMGSTYGPPNGKKMTVFIDDVNMPEINEWGDQVTAEIVRQLMENQGFYSLDRPGDWSSIVDLQFLAAMMHPGGGRNDIPARLKRQFFILNCTIPSDVSVDKIFGTILSGHFSASRGFNEAIIDAVKKLPALTRNLWQTTKTKMLPTPAKFHYIFNLRDLSRIVEGMLRAKSEVIKAPTDLLQLWEHECSRVIPDRFTNQEDIDWFNNSLRNLAGKEMGDMAEGIKEPSFFVDFMRDPPESDDPEVEVDPDSFKIYERIPSFQVLRDRLVEFMKQYNESIRGAKMDLVLFEDAMKHIVKISRILRTPRGSALLVGVGGSGKQSLTRLASFIARNQIFQISISKNYNTTNLMEDLKTLYKTAGFQGKPTTFIFTDNEVKEESFLGYINNILASGEVANLFPKDEIIAICSDLRGIMKKKRPGVLDTIENLYKFFIDRVKDNLHIVLCFSPVGEKFRARALKFPGLISGCTMDWFTRWPNEALRAVAQKFLSDMDIVCSAEVKGEVVNHMAYVHDLVNDNCNDYFTQYRRRTHVTPKSYLSFISQYKAMYQQKRVYVGQMADRMNMGLDKLLEATKSVAVLQEELVVKEKDLSVATKEADAVLAEVTASTTEAEKVKDSVLKVKVKAEQIADVIKADKAVAEGQLEAARPALEEAASALNSIQPQHISTIRKLAKPPHLIMRIMDGVLLLMKKKIDPVSVDTEKNCVKPSWQESLRLMSQSDFLSGLLNFPKDEINAETCELLEPYLEMPDFNLEGAKKVSGDVAGLASWVRAMYFYYGINKQVIPLKANLAIQERKLEMATNDLNKAQKTLDEKQAELDVFKNKYNQAIATKQALQDDADTCKRKMSAASALINGLQGEKDRWTSTSKELALRIGRLVGDVLVACAFVSYAGPFNSAFRNLLIQQWKTDLNNRTIPCTDDLDLISLLVDNTTIGEWNIEGLPTDDLSIQNGILVTKGSRYPLLIDPQGQAKAWIKSREEKNKLQVTSLSHKYFRQHVEDCVSQGRPLLIEDIDEQLDPTLDNILEKNLIKSGRSYKVIYGDKEVDYSDSFTLYLTTKLPNPNYSPEIYAKTCIIDFTVTSKGLEDQLLGRVIMREKQELETERSKLMEEINSNKKKMKQLEDNLLERLTSTKGSLVDDESLIEVLAITKSTAEEVNEKLIVAAETSKKISIAREEYRPVATRGSIVYFLIAEMSMVNVMYQTSLKQFLSLFDESMEKSQASPIPSKRIQNIIEYLTFRTFVYISRSLYEEHKLVFVLLLALKIDLQANKLTHEEFRSFIRGGAALDANAVQKKPFAWIPEMTWLNLVALSKLPAFSDLINQVTKNEKLWRAWYEKDSPETEPLPGAYEQSLDAFKKLMLLRGWCLDRTLFAARKYIASSLGQRFAESQILDFEQLLNESDHKTPLVGLLSMGGDPSADIESLARKLKVEMKNISMGQGQEVHARKLVTQFMQTGGWALLQNCHLGISFLEELLQMLLEQTDQINPKFRVWITTDVTSKFPINLLQMSIKFTNEPPQGLRAGLKRTYNWLNQDVLDMSNRPQYKSLLYGLSFLHSIVQERRKFGPIGWNIPYEFNQSDLAASAQFVQNHVDELQPKQGIQWVTVRYMFTEVHYGGRVTDDYDRRLLTTFGKVWFGDHMFADQFAFYKGYNIPQLKNIEDYRSFIDTLPLADTPEVFGLHPNADISSQTKTSQKLLDTVLSIQPKDSQASGGETREEAVKRLANDLLSKLPEDYDKNKVKAALQKLGALKPLSIFLGQEVDRIQVVLKTCRSDLKDLKLAIDGTIIMSARLQQTLDALYDARVPDNWTKVSWPAMTLGLWFTEVLNRVQQYSSWLFEGKPHVFWLTGFFNPQGFLTAIRQEITRNHQGWALDTVRLQTEVLKQMKEEITQPPSEGVYIYGLFIEGAGWDKKNAKLTESQPKVIYQPMPVIHVSATNAPDDGDSKLYRCPVYKRPRRTDLNYIFDVEMRTTQSPDYWTMRGVALLANTN